MARRFTRASNEDITTSLGALNFAFGPASVAAVIRHATVGVDADDQAPISAGNTLSVGWTFFTQTTSGTPTLGLACNSGAVVGSTGLAANKWYLVAATKATGTATARFHIYDYAAKTWVHENATSTIGNSSTPATKATVGAGAGANANQFNGDIAKGGVWNVVLTDTQVESLAQDLSDSNWNGFTKAKALWTPAPAPGTSLVDSSGGGANQSAITGTTATPDEMPLLNPTVPLLGRRTLPRLRRTPLRWFTVQQAQPAYREVIGAPSGDQTTNVGGTITPAGLLTRLAEFVLPANTITPTSVLTLVVARLLALAGTITPAATAVFKTTKALAGALTPAGTAAKAVTTRMAGTITPAGALAKRTATSLGGTITPAGALTLVSSVLQTLAAAGSITPAATAVLKTVKALAGALAPVGTLAKAVTTRMAGTITPAATLAKRAAKTLAGSVTPTGTLATSFLKLLANAGTITPAATVTSRVTKTLVGAITPTSTLAKRAASSLAGAVTPTGSLNKRAAKTMAGTVTPAGSLNVSAIAGIFNTGTITPAGTLRFSVRKGLAGTVTPTSTGGHAITTRMAGTLAPAGSLPKTYTKDLGGTIAVSAVLQFGDVVNVFPTADPTGVIDHGGSGFIDYTRRGQTTGAGVGDITSPLPGKQH